MSGGGVDRRTTRGTDKPHELVRTKRERARGVGDTTPPSGKPAGPRISPSTLWGDSSRFTTTRTESPPGPLRRYESRWGLLPSITSGTELLRKAGVSLRIVINSRIPRNTRAATEPSSRRDRRWSLEIHGRCIQRLSLSRCGSSRYE